MHAEHLELYAFKPLLAWQNRIAKWTHCPYLHAFLEGVTQLHVHNTWNLFGASVDFNNTNASQWHAFQFVLK
jgi:hypothetical protein